MITCPLPWTGIAVEPNGAVKNCAVSHDQLGSLRFTPIEEILNGAVNQSIRKSLSNNVWPEACGHCQQVEQLDPLFSNRAYQVDLHSDTDIDYTGSHQLTQLDLRWSNTCNYACVYCGPYFSSLWASELGQRVNADRENFLKLKDYAYAGLNNLKEVYLAGGEPLLIKENFDLLEELHRVNPDCLIRITTNASSLNNRIYNKICEFKNVKWEVSIEAVGSEFEYIRYPGRWAEVEKNLLQLLRNWDNVGITMNYFLLTALSIVDTGKYLIELGVDPNQMAIHPITTPKFLDSRNLNSEGRYQTLKQLCYYPDVTSTFGKSLLNCADFLSKPFDKNAEDVVYSLNAIDKRRDLNFTSIFPNLINLIK